MPETTPVLAKSEFVGWKSWRLSNVLIDLQIVPEIGGRVIQFRLADKAFFWVNPQLAGKPPPPGGLGPDRPTRCWTAVPTRSSQTRPTRPCN